MAFQSAVAFSEPDNDCLFVTSRLVGVILLWIISFSFLAKGCFRVVLGEGSGFFVGEERVGLTSLAALLGQAVFLLISADAYNKL